jgi:hypothetical protein
MDILRKLIVERTSSDYGVGYSWTVDVYFYLIGHGVKSDEAIKAMSAFVDEAFALKTMAKVT